MSKIFWKVQIFFAKQKWSKIEKSKSVQRDHLLVETTKRNQVYYAWQRPLGFFNLMNNSPEKKKGKEKLDNANTKKLGGNVSSTK